MKQTIAASAIAGIKDFAAAAASHAVEMKAWREHMARVKQDEKNDVPIERRHVACPRPRAHPMVERAVDENDEVNFEVLDDGPTATELLATRKSALMHEVSRAENRAIDAIVPAGKRRLFNLRESDIRMAEAAKAKALAASNSGLLKKVAGRTMTPEQMAARIEAERPLEDTALLLAQEERGARIEAIQRAAAQAHHDIEDLTAETIGGWKLPTF
jgi:hypothetical protein